MQKGMTIIYPEYNGLYINLTNRCPCACTFCIRQKATGAKFDNVDTLWLEREPDAKEASKYVPKVIMSTVETTISKDDEEECTRLCKELGVTHRIRKFVSIN